MPATSEARLIQLKGQGVKVRVDRAAYAARANSLAELSFAITENRHLTIPNRTKANIFRRLSILFRPHKHTPLGGYWWSRRVLPPSPVYHLTSSTLFILLLYHRIQNKYTIFYK